MNVLEQFYIKWLRISTATIAIIVFLLLEFLVPYVPQDFLGFNLQTLLEYKLVSIGFLASIFLGIELLIRKLAWKFAYPGLNLGGEWLGETFYSQREQPTSKATLKEFAPFSSEHDVYIQQDCLHISIKPSIGTSFTNWGSIAATIDSNANLKYLYWVNYGEDTKFPNSANGYEHLSATMFKGESRKGIPILLTGSFGHCTGAEKPIYSGKTVFIRKGYENCIRKKDLPEFARNSSISKIILQEG